MGYLTYNNVATFYYVKIIANFEISKFSFLLKLVVKTVCKHFLKLTEIINSDIGRDHKMEMKL